MNFKALFVICAVLALSAVGFGQETASGRSSTRRVGKIRPVTNGGPASAFLSNPESDN